MGQWLEGEAGARLTVHGRPPDPSAPSHDRSGRAGCTALEFGHSPGPHAGQIVRSGMQSGIRPGIVVCYPDDAFYGRQAKTLQMTMQMTVFSGLLPLV